MVYDRANISKLATGKVVALDSQIDTTTGTVKLRAEFDNADENLFPNQFVNARLLVRTLHDVVTAPIAAVQGFAPSTYVYLINADDTVSVRTIELGPTDGEMVQVEFRSRARRPRGGGRRRSVARWRARHHQGRREPARPRQAGPAGEAKQSEFGCGATLGRNSWQPTIAEGIAFAIDDRRHGWPRRARYLDGGGGLRPFAGQEATSLQRAA